MRKIKSLVIKKKIGEKIRSKTAATNTGKLLKPTTHNTDGNILLIKIEQIYGKEL